MTNKRIKSFIAILAGTLLVSLCGCANAIPSLSEEQEALVVEYASTAVLKHDANYHGKLVKLSSLTDEEDIASENDEEGMESQPSEGTDSQQTASADTQENDDGVTSDIPAEMMSETSAEQILGLQNASLSYSGYEVDDFYPQNGDEIYFIMNATTGNKLVVVKFTLKNNTSEEQNIAIQPGTVRIKITLNGEEKNALTTILLNDLATYQGTLEPDGETELVVIGEYSEEDLQTVDSLSVKIKNESDEVVLNCD